MIACTCVHVLENVRSPDGGVGAGGGGGGVHSSFEATLINHLLLFMSTNCFFRSKGITRLWYSTNIVCYVLFILTSFSVLLSCLTQKFVVTMFRNKLTVVIVMEKVKVLVKCLMNYCCNDMILCKMILDLVV